MNIRKLALIFLLIIVTSFSLGCKAKKAPPEEVKVTKIPVETETVKHGDFTKAIVLSGLTKPASEVTVLPKVMGGEKITHLNLEVGDRVLKGETLAVLDQDTITIQLNSAQIAYEDAKRNFDRNKVLYESGAVPRSAFEQIEVAMKNAKNNLDAQQIAFDNTIVRSPLNGVVTAVLAEEGALASAQTPIATITDLSSIEISTNINELQVNKLIVGQKVQVMIKAAGNKIVEGFIKSISPVMDERTKAYPITIVVPNKEGKIKSGMYAEVELVTDKVKNCLIVPAQAIISRDSEDKVFTVVEGKAVMNKVVPGLSNGDETVIIKGLEKGAEVITFGNEDVVEGDLVTVTNRGEE